MGRWISWSLNLRFWGAPIFSPEAPTKNLILKGFRSNLGQNLGRPHMQIQRPRIQRPFLGPLIRWPDSHESLSALKGDGTKVTERVKTQRQIFANSPLLLEIPEFGGRRKPQKTADFRRKPKISQKTAGNCRLGCVTL